MNRLDRFLMICSFLFVGSGHVWANAPAREGKSTEAGRLLKAKSSSQTPPLKDAKWSKEPAKETKKRAKNSLRTGLQEQFLDERYDGMDYRSFQAMGRKNLEPGARYKKLMRGMYQILKPPVSLKDQWRAGAFGTLSVLAAVGKGENDVQLAMQGEIQIRYHSRRWWVLGTRALAGSLLAFGNANVLGVTTWTVEPILGLQFIRQNREEWHYWMTNRGETEPYHGYAKYHRFLGHVVGIRPYLSQAHTLIWGGHLVWEFGVFTEKDEDLESIDAPNPQRMRMLNRIDLQYKSEFRLGYLHTLGFGGSWKGTLTWGVLHITFELGAYVGDRVFILLAPTVGLLFS